MLLGLVVRMLGALLLVLAASASAEPTHVLGFITVEGHHPALRCTSPEQPVAVLTLTNGPRTVLVRLSCVSAPALAFAVELSPGTWRLELTPLDAAPFDAGTLETRLRVGERTLLVTVDAARRSVTAKPAGVSRQTPLLARKVRAP